MLTFCIIRKMTQNVNTCNFLTKPFLKVLNFSLLEFEIQFRKLKKVNLKVGENGLVFHFWIFKVKYSEKAKCNFCYGVIFISCNFELSPPSKT